MIKKIFEKPITVLMLTITVFIFGLISLYKLPVQLMPSGAGDVLAIITNYHGVSPEQIEKTVTVPVENAIGGIEGIKKVYSVSEDGKSRVIVYFYPGKDIDYAALKIREAVEGVSFYFPKACEKPYVIKNDPEDKPVFIMNLKNEDMRLTELRAFAENKIKKEIARIDGISEIEFSGGSLKEIHIDANPGALIAYGIDITKISSLIQEAYFVNSQGKIKEYNKDTVLYTDARFTSIEEMRMLPVMYDKERKSAVLLKDIADVYEGIREPDNISRLNGEERVSIYIRKSGDANTLKVCNELLKYIENSSDKKIQFEIIYNQGEYIKRAIDNVKFSAVLGGIIAVIVLLLFIRNLRSVILISFAMPFSIVLTFFLMYLFKIDINVMTLSGFALGVGMLLDNSVVMIEFLNEDMKTGLWQNSNMAISPIISSTLTTIAIFFPITFVNYEFRRLYGGLALTVTFSLVSSIIAALVIIPAGYGFFKKFLKYDNLKHDTKISDHIVDFSMKAIIFFWKRIKFLYVIIIVFIVLLPVIIISIDKEYIDPASSNEITAYVEMEAGASLEETERLVSKVESIFKEESSILRINSRIQKWHADIDLKYDVGKFSSQEKFMEHIKKKTDAMKECFVHYEEKSDNEGRVIDIDIIGDNDDKLREIAEESAKNISEVKGIRNVVLKFKEGKPSLTWVIDRDKCQQFMVPISAAGEQLRWAIYGPVALKYIKDNKEMDLRISYPKEYKKSLDDVKKMIIYNINNDQIHIKDIGSFIEGREPGRIYRLNKRKTVRIGAYLGNISLSKAVPLIKKSLKSVNKPDGYYFDYGDILIKLKESQTVAVFAVLLSIIIVFSILAIQFESFIIPLKIIPIIIISASFSVFVLFALRMSLNLSVYIGLIILGGVVVNNTILITEGILSFKKVNNFTVYRVIKTRLKPVYVTTLTTILALIPMIFQFGEGSELWRPLSITLVTGLTYGTFINLTAYPALFLRFRKKG